MRLIKHKKSSCDHTQTIPKWKKKYMKNKVSLFESTFVFGYQWQFCLSHWLFLRDWQQSYKMKQCIYLGACAQIGAHTCVQKLGFWPVTLARRTFVNQMHPKRLVVFVSPNQIYIYLVSHVTNCNDMFRSFSKCIDLVDHSAGRVYFVYLQKYFFQ